MCGPGATRLGQSAVCGIWQQSWQSASVRTIAALAHPSIQSARLLAGTGVSSAGAVAGRATASPCRLPPHPLPAEIPNPHFGDTLTGLNDVGNGQSRANCNGRSDTWYQMRDACYLWVAQYGSYQLAWGCDASSSKPKYQQTETYCYWYQHGHVSDGVDPAGGAAGCVQPGVVHGGSHAMVDLR
jgi:hypothetical protein